MDKVFRPCVRKLAIAGETEIQPAANEVATCRRSRLHLLMAAAGAEITGPADAAIRLGVHVTLHQKREAPTGIERGRRSQAIIFVADLVWIAIDFSLMRESDKSIQPKKQVSTNEHSSISK